MPSTSFPSLALIQARVDRGGQLHDVHQICLDAIAEGGRSGDILKQTKRRLCVQGVIKAINQEPPEYFEFDYEEVAPSHIPPPGPDHIKLDPRGEEFAGP